MRGVGEEERRARDGTTGRGGDGVETGSDGWMHVQERHEVGTKIVHEPEHPHSSPCHCVCVCVCLVALCACACVSVLCMCSSACVLCCVVVLPASVG